MPRGGKREGAGRQSGGKNIKNRKTARAYLADNGVKPLDVMMAAMRRAWDEDNIDEAVKHAIEAAPYMHAKLGNVKVSGDPKNPLQTRIELVIVDPSPRAAGVPAPSKSWPV